MTAERYQWAMGIKSRYLAGQPVDHQELADAQRIVNETRRQQRECYSSDEQEADAEVAVAPAAPPVCVVTAAPGTMVAALIQAASEKPAVRVVGGFEYRCVDCGGPRSYASGQRCIACYKERAAANKAARLARKASKLRLQSEELVGVPPAVVAELSTDGKAAAAEAADLWTAEMEHTWNNFFAAVPRRARGERPLPLEIILARSEAPKLDADMARDFMKDWGAMPEDEEFVLADGTSAYRVADQDEEAYVCIAKTATVDLLDKVDGPDPLDPTVLGAYLHRRHKVSVVDFYGVGGQ